MLAAAEHPGVAARLLAHATAPTVTAISHARVALDGDATASAVGRFVTVHGTGFVAGGGAVCNVSSTDTFEGFARGFAYDPEHVLQVKAEVLSPTALTCLLPQVPTGGPAQVAVSMEGSTFGPNASIAFEYFPLVSFAVGRRPYTAESEGKLIVGVAPELLRAGPTQVSATIRTTPPIFLTLTPSVLDAPDNVLSFPLSKLPPHVDAVISLSVSASLGPRGRPLTVEKTRRIVRVPLQPSQEAIVVDHHTRGLSLIKPVASAMQSREVQPWLGTGWYIYSGFECDGQSNAPGTDWGNGPGSCKGAHCSKNFTDVVNELARRGFNQLMIYDLETVVCDGKSMESTLLPLMDAIAAVGMRVMVSVKDWMQQSADHRTGGPGSHTYEMLKNTTDLLGNHRALLGWYVCDDCCPGGGKQGDEEMKNYSASYKILKSLDPFHPAFGAIQCPRSWEFLDGPGSRGDDGPGFDVPMHENYDPSFPGHAGQGPRAPIEQALGDMPLRSYPVEYEPIVNCPWGESTQYYLFVPRVEGGAGPMGGVPVAPMSPDGLRGIGWLGTVYDLHDVLWYTYNKLGSGSPGPKDRLATAASQLAFEMNEVFPSLTAVKDGTVPRAVATAVTSNAELLPWVRARAWAEPPAPGTTGTVSTGEWNPVSGIDPGMCKPNGQMQTVGTPCATSAVCVHVLVANTSPHAATTAVHVKIVDRFGIDTGQLSGSLHATLPFASFESGEMLPVRDGTFSDTIPAFSVRMFRLGCAAPPIAVGNLVPNPSFEDGTITGAVASWGLFAQHEQRDQRVMLTSDTTHAHHGRHSARLVLPTEHPGGVVTYQGYLAVPFSLGGGQASPDCGNGYQGFYMPAGFRYNISIWARSDDFGMNVSIASGRWAASVASKVWEYTGKPQVSLAPLTPSWTQLSWQHSANTTECLQLLVAGQGQINLDDAFISRVAVPSKTDDDVLQAEIAIEHGSALVGRGYKSSQSSLVGLPVQMAKGETDSAHVVIRVTADTSLHGVTVSAQVVAGLEISVALVESNSNTWTSSKCD